MAVHGKHRIARGIRRHRDEHMGDPPQRSLIDWPVAVEQDRRKAGLAQQILAFDTSAGSGNRPARRNELTAKCQRAVAQAETKEMRLPHDGRRTGTTAGSASSVWAMRLCLSRVQAQKPHDTNAPTASGRRSPKRSLNEPINTAPPAGPARKIMP